jgi:hypothetical protein
MRRALGARSYRERRAVVETVCGELFDVHTLGALSWAPLFVLAPSVGYNLSR